MFTSYTLQTIAIAGDWSAAINVPLSYGMFDHIFTFPLPMVNSRTL